MEAIENLLKGKVVNCQTVYYAKDRIEQMFKDYPML